MAGKAEENAVRVARVLAGKAEENAAKVARVLAAKVEEDVAKEARVEAGKAEENVVREVQVKEAQERIEEAPEIARFKQSAVRTLHHRPKPEADVRKVVPGQAACRPSKEKKCANASRACHRKSAKPR